jgi:hypothetical protein
MTVSVVHRECTKTRFILIDRDIGNKPIVSDKDGLREPSLEGEN